jgi:hypothetical protein
MLVVVLSMFVGRSLMVVMCSRFNCRKTREVWLRSSCTNIREQPES